MTDQSKLDGHADALKDNSGDNTISPLPGEAGIPNVASRPSVAMSRKGLLAVALLAVSLVAVSAFSAQRFIASHKKAEDGDSKLVSDRPSAATADPRRLEMPAPAVAATVTTPRIPALLPTAADSADPIGVRRTGQGAGGNGRRRHLQPTRVGGGGTGSVADQFGVAVVGLLVTGDEALSGECRDGHQRNRHQGYCQQSLLRHRNAGAGRDIGYSGLPGQGRDGVVA